VAAIRAIGESPDRKSLIDSWGHRDIGDPGDKVFGHFGITKSKTLTRGKASLWEPTVSISEKWKVSFKGPAVSVVESRDLRNQQSHGKMFLTFKTLKPRWETRLWSWGEWSYGPGA
jgi:hypothetical protein